ncbi:MAG: hypothetical protein QG625_2083 [Cyanobacteriota bacterium erpe_2018_sw_39hr_WHONDRS-SW48-000098_B_bin.30]|jgi:hypothetical protein|nr:hypothetical protein [Cyanobacteriota bacterium erpe_2018_sw_39hr_WHONDRS-SW48-000098_B_bin.30]
MSKTGDLRDGLLDSGRQFTKVDLFALNIHSTDDMVYLTTKSGLTLKGANDSPIAPGEIFGYLQNDGALLLDAEGYLIKRVGEDKHRPVPSRTLGDRAHLAIKSLNGIADFEFLWRRKWTSNLSNVKKVNQQFDWELLECANVRQRQACYAGSAGALVLNRW